MQKPQDYMDGQIQIYFPPLGAEAHPRTKVPHDSMMYLTNLF